TAGNVWKQREVGCYNPWQHSNLGEGILKARLGNKKILFPKSSEELPVFIIKFGREIKGAAPTAYPTGGIPPC
ncbi:MAG: hypothetical protein P8175_07920, partial [Deltaproteobacteria bacterium]